MNVAKKIEQTVKRTNQYNFPQDHKEFTDKYFLRTREILEKEGLNPYVRAQVFVRKGPGVVKGLDEAVELIEHYAKLSEKGDKIYALKDGMDYQAGETLMVIEGRIQDIVELETMYLGVIAAEITKYNDGIDIDLESIENNMKAVTQAAKRPVSYFGARHWKYDRDAEIAKAAFKGGATSCSTDVGAKYANQKGMGTIPHALENVFAHKYGLENAVVEATKAFDRHMPKDVPRVALIDYANKELDDTIATANALEGRLYGVRVDTCGENVAQGGIAGDKEYWHGTGVTVEGIKALREALDNAGHKDVKIMLSSGFGSVKKVEVFVEAEKELGMKLFDGLGVGGVFKARYATMDIVAVGDDENTLQPMSKVGRVYKPNARLKRVI